MTDEVVQARERRLAEAVAHVEAALLRQGASFASEHVRLTVLEDLYLVPQTTTKDLVERAVSRIALGGLVDTSPHLPPMPAC